MKKSCFFWIFFSGCCGMDLLHQLLGSDLKAGMLTVLAIILIEGVLSVDNAAVLAQMVMPLKPEDRGRALRIGLFLGYFLRGICIMLVGVLVKFWWISAIGGGYLLLLAIKHFAKKEHVEEEAHEAVVHEGSWLFRHLVRMCGTFWATVISVETMDLMFSVDNVIAANAMAPNNIPLIIFGVFVGILIMRFAAQGFVTLMHKYQFLETCAFLVIGLLGIKLLAEVVNQKFHLPALHHVLESNAFRIGWSVMTLAIFFLPVLTYKLFGFPKSKK